jgi:hypothetical protein
MSAWRRIAIEKLRQHRGLIERCESVGRLWVDLWLIFVAAHRPPADEATIKSVYEFAAWCLAESRNGGIATSTVCHFYEHLPTEPLVRWELPRYMSRQDFLGMSEVFKYHLSAEEHAAFVRDFMEGKERLLKAAI